MGFSLEIYYEMLHSLIDNEASSKHIVFLVTAIEL
jgi:hypothetical protein